MENKIPTQFFFKHVEKLREVWKDVRFTPFQKANHDMDSIILVNGKGSAGNEKTIAIVGWFFAGFSLAETIIAFSPTAIIIYASDRKGNSPPIQSPSSATSRKTPPPNASTSPSSPKPRTTKVASPKCGANSTKRRPHPKSACSSTTPK